MPWGVTPLLWPSQFTHQLEVTSANGQVPETLRRVGSHTGTNGCEEKGPWRSIAHGWDKTQLMLTVLLAKCQMLCYLRVKIRTWSKPPLPSRVECCSTLISPDFSFSNLTLFSFCVRKAPPCLYSHLKWNEAWGNWAAVIGLSRMIRVRGAEVIFYLTLSIGLRVLVQQASINSQATKFWKVGDKLLVGHWWWKQSLASWLQLTRLQKSRPLPAMVLWWLPFFFRDKSSW